MAENNQNPVDGLNLASNSIADHPKSNGKNTSFPEDQNTENNENIGAQQNQINTNRAKIISRLASEVSKTIPSYISIEKVVFNFLHSRRVHEIRRIAKPCDVRISVNNKALKKAAGSIYNGTYFTKCAFI